MRHFYRPDDELVPKPGEYIATGHYTGRIGCRPLVAQYVRVNRDGICRRQQTNLCSQVTKQHDQRRSVPDAYVVTGPTTRHIQGMAEINGQPGRYQADVDDQGEPGVADRIN